MSEQKSEATQSDESQVSDFDFDALADDVLGLTPEEATQESNEDTEGLTDDDPIVDEDAEEVDEVEEDNEEEEAEDEDESTDATQDDDADDSEEGDEGEIDMDFAVPVKIDGEESNVTMDELITNYQTKQHQSKKGDELAKQAKELDAYKADAQVFAQINARLLQDQDDKDKRILSNLEKKVDEAYAEDDYDASKLERQLNKATQEYGQRKANRDSMLENMGRKVQEEQVGKFNKQVEAFHTAIPEYVPDWSNDVAQANREFALKGGLPEYLVDSMVDPAVVAFVDKFRRLAETTSKGAVKRKKAPVKRVATKKPISKTTKKSNRVDQSRQRINKGKGSESDSKVLFDNVIDNMFG
ncbi:MAG: hypothetical protein ABGY11_05325 [Candidatus Thioglobus sp.]|jgi:hypothetical protein